MPAALHEPRVFADVGEMPREEWLGVRSRGMGGSDAAPAAGLSPWTPPIALWAEKRGLGVAPREETRQMHWGHLHEPTIAAEFTARHPELEVIHDTRMFQHPDLPWMIASPDRRLGVEGVLEIKTVDKDAASEWDEGPPVHYVCQVLHYFEVMGARFGFIAALIGGNDYREFVVERDEAAIGSIIRIEDVFWNVNVLQGVEPRIVGTDAEARWLGKRYPGNAGQDILLPPEILDDLAELRRIKAELKEYEDAKTYLENKIKAYMGDATEGLDPSIGADYPVVTWRPQEPMKFSEKAFAERYPHTHRAFKRPSHARPMLVKEAERPKRKPRKR